MENHTVSLATIKRLALKHKFVLTDGEARIIQAEFAMNVLPNLTRFKQIYQRYALQNQSFTHYFQINDYLRSDQVKVQTNRAEFLINIENKTPDGYVYVLKRK